MSLQNTNNIDGEEGGEGQICIGHENVRKDRQDSESQIVFAIACTSLRFLLSC